mgnify:FL=1|jgi:hypothetical protein
MKKLITLLAILFCTTAFANPYGFYQIQMPVVCGTPDAIESYIKAKNFDAVGISLGRAGSQPDGEPVFLLTFYANSDNESLMTMDIPSGFERCILFHSFNTALLPEKKGT